MNNNILILKDNEVVAITNLLKNKLRCLKGRKQQMKRHLELLDKKSMVDVLEEKALIFEISLCNERIAEIEKTLLKFENV